MALKLTLLLLAASTVRSQNGLCSTPSLRFSIGSHHNATGHHIITADLLSDHPSGGSHNGTTLDVEAGCMDSNAARLSAVAVPLPTPPQVRHKVPPPGYEVVPNIGMYKVYDTSKTWIDAHDTCEKEGSHLMVLNSQAEADTVPQLCAKTPCPNWLWSGFHDQFKQGHYNTVTGQLLSETGYTVWESGQPNNDRCGCFTKIGKLCDYTCTSSLPFICEFHSQM